MNAISPTMQNYKINKEIGGFTDKYGQNKLNCAEGKIVSDSGTLSAKWPSVNSTFCTTVTEINLNKN